MADVKVWLLKLGFYNYYIPQNVAVPSGKSQ